MQIEFTLSAADVREYWKHVYARLQKKSKLGSLPAWLGVCAWAALLLGVAGFYHFLSHYSGAERENLLLTAALVTFSAATSIGSRVLHRRWVAQVWLAPDAALLQRRRIELAEDGIQVSTPETQERYQWGAIKGVSSSSNLFCLHLDSHTALLIPKRAFATEAESAHAFRLIEQWRRPGAQIES
ncbi:MAG: YcxB family protein [Dokdonella sp.]